MNASGSVSSSPIEQLPHLALEHFRRRFADDLAAHHAVSSTSQVIGKALTP
jgi:hypothetical protein